MSTDYDTAPRLSLISASMASAGLGLVPGSGSTISLRHHSGMLITPAVIPAQGMTADDVVYVHDRGVIDGTMTPGLDRRVHLAVLHARLDIASVVRLQTPAATAIACLRHSLPVFHYMVAVAVGGRMRCAPFAPPGSATLGEHAVAGLGGRQACLLANNGLLVVGSTPGDALRLGIEVEALCDQYLRARALAEPVVLTSEDLSMS